MKTKIKKILLFLAVVMLFAVLSCFNASAVTHNADEAIVWVRSLVNNPVGSGECVALVNAYYSYLGASPASGNAIDYKTNTLPLGWQRLQGVQPQKGDILVYNGGIGHVGIYESDWCHYHQNFNYQRSVVQVTNIPYNRLDNSYWGVIRPNFSKLPVGVVDEVSGGAGHIRVRGWSFDKSDLTKGLNIHVYIGDEYHPYIYADKERPDVDNIYGCGKNHGFDAIINTALTGNQTVRIYAINIDGESNPLLYMGTINITKAKQYSLDINVMLDDELYETGLPEITFDLYFNGTRVANDVSSYKNLYVTAGVPYEIKDIKYPDNYSISQETISGVVDSDKHINIIFEKPHSHSYTSKTTNLPTCITEGYTIFTCDCGASYVTDKVDATGHTETTVKGKTATCISIGLTDGEVCSTCGTVIVKQEEIPTVSHKDDNGDYKCDFGCGYEFEKPVIEPTTQITTVPTTVPTTQSTTVPTTVPTTQPTTVPTTVPTTQPTTVLTTVPTTATPATTQPTTQVPVVTEPSTTDPSTTVHNHTVVVIPAVEATYIKDGLTAGVKCSTCGEILEEQKTVSRKKLGKVMNLKVKSAKTTSVSLSWKKVTGAESYKVYYSTNGKKWKSVKATKNSVTVKKLTSGKSYQFKVKAVAGKYEGITSSVVKTATKVSSPNVKSLKSSKAKQAVVTWNKVNGADGYVIEYSTSKKFTKKTTKTVKVKKGKTTKTTLKKLKSGKKYYVRIRAYKTVSKKTVYGSYSSVKTVKIK